MGPPVSVSPRSGKSILQGLILSLKISLFLRRAIKERDHLFAKWPNSGAIGGAVNAVWLLFDTQIVIERCVLEKASRGDLRSLQKPLLQSLFSAAMNIYQPSVERSPFSLCVLPLSRWTHHPFLTSTIYIGVGASRNRFVAQSKCGLKNSGIETLESGERKSKSR